MKRLESPEYKRVVADAYGLVVVTIVGVLNDNSSQSNKVCSQYITMFITRRDCNSSLGGFNV